MTFEVKLRVEAEQDIEDAANWYQRQRPGLGHEFLDEVEVALDRIKDSPRAYPIVYKEFHRALIQKFPFGIHYLVEKTRVVIYAVMHASRDPKSWKART